MSTYESNGLTRYYLKRVSLWSGYLWLILFLIMGMADIAQYAGLAESATTVTATGAISGKILDQSGQSLTNIQVLALKESATGGGYSSPFLHNICNYPPWMPEELSIAEQPFYSYAYAYSSSYTGTLAAPDAQTLSLYRTLSKSDGTFLLSNLPEGRYDLWAYDPQGRGFEPAIFGLNISQDELKLLGYPYSTQNILIKVKSGQTAGQFSLTMYMGGKLSGRVTDAATGLPVKGATVQAYTYGWGYYTPVRFYTSSDLTGSFTFCGMPEGKTLVSVTWAEGYKTALTLGYYPFQENTYSVVAGQETSGCNLALEAGGAVSGKVTSQADGKPVAGAEISCFMTKSSVFESSGYYQSTPVISGEDGTYRISGLELGTYIPMVQYVPGFQNAYYPNTLDANQASEIQIEEGKETGPIDFQLAPAKGKGIIRGLIIDKQSGLPLAGIQVNLNKMYYSYSYPPPTKDVIIMRNRDEAVSNSSSVNVTGSPAISSVGYSSAGSGTMATGVATTAYASAVNEPMAVSQQPVPTTTVVPPSSVVMPVASGTGGVNPSYTVSAYSSAYSSTYPIAYPSTYASASYLPPLDYPRFDPVLTDQEGKFAFTCLENDKYYLSAYDPTGRYMYANYPEYVMDNQSGYYTMGSIELSETQPVIGDIEITMHQGGCLEGKLLAGSTPVAGIQVRVLRTDQGSNGDPYYYKDPYGGVSYDSGYGVSYSSGYSSASYSDYSGTSYAVSAPYVSVGYPGGSSDVTDTAGEFSICGLEDGEYALLAEDTTGTQNYMLTYCLDSNTEGKKRVFAVSAGSTITNLVISINTGASISGKVVDKNGKPLPGISVSSGVDWTSSYTGSYQSDFYYSYPPTRYAVTAEDGTYTLIGLSDATYTLTATDQSGEYQENCCSGIKGTPPAMAFAPDLVLPKSLVLSGRVTSQDGQPLAKIQIYASIDYSSDYSSTLRSDKTQSVSSSCSSSSISYGEAYTNEDGTYRISGLTAGSYQLVAYDQEGKYLKAQYGTGSLPSVITGTEGEVKANLDFQLTKGGTIKGTIRDAATGKPISGLTVMAQCYTPMGSSGTYGGGYISKPDGGYYDVYAPAYDPSYALSYDPSYDSYAVASVPVDGDYGYSDSGYTTPNGYAAPAGYATPDGYATAAGMPETQVGQTQVQADVQGVLYIKSYSGKIGEEVKIPVVIQTASHEVFSLGFEMTYDPGVLEYLGFEKGNPVSSFAMFEASLQNPGRIRIGGYSLTDAIPNNSCDILVWLKFRVDGSQQNGCTPLGLEKLLDDLGQFATEGGSFCTGDAESVDMTISSGIATAPPSATIMPTIIDTGYYPSYGIAGYGSVDGGQIYYSIPSDSEGNYSLNGLCAGEYYVYILTDSTGMNYMSQYYQGVSSMDEATPLEVGTTQTIENIDFNLSAGIILKGTVKDAVTGKPITGLGCLVYLTNEQGQYVISSYTGATGDYQFLGLQSGTYFVMVSDCQEYYPAYYRQTTDDQKPSSPITLSLPGPVEGIDILLYHKASISGQVVDEFDRKPLANIMVTALIGIPASSAAAVAPGDLKSSELISYAYCYRYATTDVNGLYTIKGLEEGDYQIMAYDYKHLYGGEYYKDVPLKQPEKANIVHVGRTGDAKGIDLALQVGETYTGADITSFSSVYYTADDSSLYGGLYGSSYGSSSSVPSVNVGSGDYSVGYAALSGDTQPQGYDPYGQAGSSNQSPTVSTTDVLTQTSADASKNVSAPEIVSSNSIEKITAGRTFTYQVKVNESAANASLVYSLTQAPEGMNIDQDSGVVQWKPSNSDAGQCIVQLKVDNGSGQVALQAFRLGVEADTTPPEEIATPTAAKGDRKVTISWTPCTDSDSDLADQILYVKEGNASYSSGISLGKDTATYTVLNLENGKAYTFKITTSDELANESNGVTVTATPAKEQAVDAGNQQTSGYSLAGLSSWLFSPNYLFNISNATTAGLWGILPSSPWSTTETPSSWTSSLWTNSNSLWTNSNLPWSSSNSPWSNSNSPWSNSTSTLGLWNTSPVTSLWGNTSTTSSGGIFGTKSLWDSSLGSSNLFTNQDNRTRSLQPWDLFF